MEYKNCEQYVLDRLFKAEDTIQKLLDDQHMVGKRNIELAVRVMELEEIVKGFYENIEQRRVPNTELFAYVFEREPNISWDSLDCAYAKAEEMFGNRKESDSEE